MEEPRIEADDGARDVDQGEGDDTLQTILGYKPELQRNRSMFTLLFQSLAIAAIPFGEGAPLISAIYGGGQRAIFIGWLRTLSLETGMNIVELIAVVVQ